LPCRFVFKGDHNFHGSICYLKEVEPACFLLQGQQSRAERYLELNRELAMTQDALVREQNVAKRHEAAIKGLDEFLSVLMHDIRSPLCTIWTSLQLAQEDLERKDLPGLGDMLDSGSSSTKRLLDFVDRLYQNIRVGQSDPQLEMLDIGMIVKELKVDLLSQFRASGAALKIVGKLPCVQADRQLVRQLFQNLMQNAMKFRAPARGLVIEIGTRSVSRGVLDLYVKDNGEGFPNEDAARLFERYHKNSKNSGNKEANDGMGIGLATCKLIAEKHKWTIRAEAEVGAGASFIIRIPVE